jgi:predicted MFS family arabinose efflux permease
MLKTMVFTHLPAQVFLVLVPLMPTFWLAAFFLLCRQSLSKMDVPTRQAYIMELVVPEERTAAASFTTMTRSVATSISPVVAGMLFTGSLLALGLPFLFGGGLEIFYDILLYRIFRNVKIAC